LVHCRVHAHDVGSMAWARGERNSTLVPI
jgi:hypothetical protein